MKVTFPTTTVSRPARRNISQAYQTGSSTTSSNQDTCFHKDNHSHQQEAVSQYQLVTFKRHEPISLHQGGLWRIQSGYARSLTWNLDGEPIPLGFWTTGDIVGQEIPASHQLESHSVRPYEVQCLSTVTAEYLGDRYSLSKAAVQTRATQSNDLLRIAHCRHTEIRLLLFVSWLAKKFGKPAPEGLQVDIKLTHQEIAESVGITRVTVSRLLKALERQGKIEWTTQEKRVNYATLKACGAP